MDPIVLATSAYDTSALWAQWVGSVAAVASVAVAIVFGYLTLANTRRSKDAQERAAFAAADRDDRRPGTGLTPNVAAGTAEFSVRAAGGERWELRNDGTAALQDVRVAGLTSLDARRLTFVGEDTDTLEPGGILQFVLVSRLALSGPANIVVRYRTTADGPEFRQVLLVPAP